MIFIGLLGCGFFFHYRFCNRTSVLGLFIIYACFISICINTDQNETRISIGAPNNETCKYISFITWHPYTDMCLSPQPNRLIIYQFRAPFQRL